MGLFGTVKGWFGFGKPKQPEPGSLDAWLLDGTWLTLASSDIEAIRYLYDEQILEVEFRNNSPPDKTFYQMQAVPPEVAKALAEASSPGRYFWSHIKGVYDFVRLPGLGGAGPRKPNVVRHRPDLSEKQRQNLPSGQTPPRRKR